MNISLNIHLPPSRRGWRKDETLAEDVLKMLEHRTCLKLEMVRQATGISIWPEGNLERWSEISSYKS